MAHPPGLTALQLPPGPLLADGIERAWDRGEAVLPLADDLPADRRARLLAELRPHALVDASGTHPLPRPLPVPAGTAAVVATSGSGGPPKGVTLSHAALSASARASLDRLDAQPHDRWLACLPLHHVAGLQVLVRSRVMGTPPVVHPGFDAEAVAAATRASCLALVPTMLARLLDGGVDLARYRVILLGGALPPPGLVDSARAAGARVVTSYGLTETAGGCVYDGFPLDGVDVAFDAGQTAPDGPRESGRIHIRGPMLMTGYHGRAELTAEVLDDRGWLRTADLGRWDAEGRLEVVGRADDVIVTGGENVAGDEVAALLAAHPRVADAGVVARADPEWGERVVAVCVPADAGEPPTLGELRAFLSERLPAHAAPRELVLTSALPRTALGKPDRARIQQLVAGSEPVETR